MLVDHIDRLKNRIIALAGDKEICRQFYLQFFPFMEIRYLFLTDCDFAFDSADCFFEKNHQITCMPLKESLVMEQNLLIVLCSDRAERQLYDPFFFNKGLEWGKDYTDYIYVIQYYRHKYRVALEEKDIWIFGAGNNGRYFYEKYKNSYQIRGFLSNYDEEKEYLGLPVIRPSDFIKKTDCYIVICSDAAAAMARQLHQLGLDGRKEYGFMGTLPKKLFVAMGVCQIIKTAGVMCKNRAFFCRYHTELYLDNAYEPFRDADNRRLKAYGRFCDVVFYNIANAGMTELRNFEPMIHRFYPKALRLFLPFYTFKGQLPQATDCVNCYAVRELMAYGGRHFWFRGDQEMNRMAEEGYSPEDMIEKISSLDYWSEQEIKDGLQKELKKIEILDRLSSFPIKSFIEENYRKILVFIDGTHFSYQLCRYLANEMAKCLHLELMDDAEVLNEGTGSRTSVMPVYPCVIHALGMEREDSWQFYNPEKDQMEYLNMKEYARRYIRYIDCVRGIQKESGTIMAY